MQHVSEVLTPVMGRLSCINELRQCEAMLAVENAINQMRDWNDRWGHTMEPEEKAKTLRILGSLLDLQANETLLSVREGEAMNIRLTEAAREDAANDSDDTDPTPPAAIANAA